MENLDLFKKFNEEIDVEGLREDIENATKPVERVKVPFGDYEVAITKLSLGENTYVDSPSYGCPQVNIWFKVVSGEYKGQIIFWSTNLFGQYMGLSIKNVNDFLDTLESGIEIQFTDFVQYAKLLEAVFEAIDERFEYHLSYGEGHSKSGKPFKTYTILQKFNKA